MLVTYYLKLMQRCNPGSADLEVIRPASKNQSELYMSDSFPVHSLDPTFSHGTVHQIRRVQKAVHFAQSTKQHNSGRLKQTQQVRSPSSTTSGTFPASVIEIPSYGRGLDNLEHTKMSQQHEQQPMKRLKQLEKVESLHRSLTMGTNSSPVSMVPAQDDIAAATSSEAVRNGPLYLTLRDIRVFFTKLYLFPFIFIPFRTDNPTDELYVGGKNLPGLISIGIASIYNLGCILIGIPLLIFVPASVFFLLIAISVVTLHVFTWPIQGPSATSTSSEVLAELGDLVHHHRKEKWIFVNGVAVSGWALQQNVDRLSKTFRRPVLGIHNRTYGLIGDVAECIIQRAFGYYTEDTRFAYEYVKTFCADPAVDKVVLIGHSQGGIVVSNILDQIFADIPSQNVSKLEVYTFGNAASHFNNPFRSSLTRLPHQKTPTLTSPVRQSSPSASNHHEQRGSPRRIIPYIEHYANSEDMVTRWGVLYSIKHILDNRFCGKVFIHRGATGHMLNQHYLKQMFPLPGERTELDGQTSYLDQLVDVDNQLQDQRQKRVDELLGMTMSDRAANSRNGRWLHPPVLHIDGDGDSDQENGGTENGHTASIKTVRDLSRLWRYLDGRSPDR